MTTISPCVMYVINIQWMTFGLFCTQYYAVEKNCQKPRNSPDVGDICACQYSGDKLWYRAEVEDVVSRSRVVVRYVDYGNEEEVEISSICELSREFKVIPKLVS